MIAQTLALSGSTPIGDLFETDSPVGMFDGDASLQEIFAYFAQHAADAVIITEEAVSVGILTLKDAVRALQNWENLLLPVREFMASPLQTFDAIQKVSDVIDLIHEAPYDKIIVKHDDSIIGMMDRRDLLALCYTRITPLIKHEYHMIHSLMELAGDGKKRLLKMATTDALTGIGNRRLFEEAFHAHQKLSGHYSITMFLLMLDIDGFKHINDVYGHNVGDTVLRQLTELISHSIRKSDIFVRWGGEEFAILMHASDTARATDVAEQLRRKIELYRFETILHLTCSFGVTPILPGETLEAVFERADKALYRAKNDGKNSVRVEMAAKQP